ncbi:hypothetical protein DFO66_103311 [Brevibacterium sanguinis]|uniref:IrrE N-terminal-like domain-containing protein n=2 Tax=Brevibacterium TaxID=1696 RepID=A0A366IN55_9MICO|nr:MULTISPECIES: ImmA/IrrE family metallo-endopeptidase [Brevibacterium]RBP66364.1 hypothetical protein DFO66_103311 [Brevibacterium sanguinis]RBP73015.1 hypothetical protein DFO65_103310 [Brevibacterium celere]
MYHPWHELRDLGDGVVLHFTSFPDSRVSATNGSNAIWIDIDLDQVERRCALTHELAHLDLGHATKTTDREERDACRLTAVRLIDWDDLVDAYRWATCMDEWADELWVTPEVLQDRLRFLAPIERALLEVERRRKHE